MIFISPASSLLRDKIKERIQKGEGVYDKDVIRGCAMCIELIDQHLNPKAELNESQAYQLANLVILKAHHLPHGGPGLSALEIIQIATFINTCKL